MRLFRTGSSCGSPDMGCGVTYSFQNRLPLSDKTDEFTVSFDKANALMYAILIFT